MIVYSPDENNVLPYLKAMGRLRDGVDAIEKSQLKSCDKTIYQMVIYDMAEHIDFVLNVIVL